MEGSGRVYHQNAIYDGLFKQGNLTGVGIYHNLRDDVYMYGYYENNFCRELIKSGKGYPLEIVGT